MKTVIDIILFICIVIAPFYAGAESAGSLVDSGNALYAAGEYDKALEAYEKALAEQPDSGEILFDKGSACFKKGEYEKAREAYQAAALKTKDLSLEASAHYNLGNTIFAEGQKQLEADPKKALSQWGQSIHHYQEALRIDPGLKEAAQNIEVVRLGMKDLADRIKKAEEAARERQKQQEEKQKEPEDSRDNAGQCPNPKPGGEGEEEKPGDREQEKAAPQDQPDEEKEKSAAPAQPAPKQQSAEDKPLAGNEERGEKGDDKKAGAVFSESPENILREEKENRLQLHRTIRGGYKPVEKDW